VSARGPGLDERLVDGPREREHAARRVVDGNTGRGDEVEPASGASHARGPVARELDGGRRPARDVAAHDDALGRADDERARAVGRPPVLALEEIVERERVDLVGERRAQLRDLRGRDDLGAELHLRRLERALRELERLLPRARGLVVARLGARAGEVGGGGAGAERAETEERRYAAPTEGHQSL